MSDSENKMKPKITEPMTLVTDYLIGIEALVFVILLLLSAFGSSTLAFSRIALAISFIFTAIASFAGGTAHGFTEFFKDQSKNDHITWKLTVHSLGVSTMFLEAMVIFSMFASIIRIVLLTIILLQFLGYELYLNKQPELTFKMVILNYLPSMVIILILELVNWLANSDASGMWMVIGIVISFLAAIVQVSKVTPHRLFNHNDLYHVIQMIGFYFFLVAGLVMTDSV